VRKESRELHAVWEQRINAQRASGLSRKEWCAAEGLSPNTFQGWIGRLGMQKKSNKQIPDGGSAFVKIVPTRASTQEPDGIEGIELSIIRLRLPVGYDRIALRDLIEGLADH